ncbi:CopD family protein [Longispora fulva]|uniref:CopD family protein n=1 Tax=Longispora fulva TaxID=619741 RepID=UPI00364315FD
MGFVLLLYIYHMKCHFIFKELQNDIFKWTSNQMRLWNEVSTLILFAVVFLVILKNAFNWIYGVIGIFVLAGLLMLGIRIYKRMRNKNPEL